MSDQSPLAAAKRRWFRFGLGTFLMFVAAVAVALDLTRATTLSDRGTEGDCRQHQSDDEFQPGDGVVRTLRCPERFYDAPS